MRMQLAEKLREDLNKLQQELVQESDPAKLEDLKEKVEWGSIHLEVAEEDAQEMAKLAESGWVSLPVKVYTGEPSWSGDSFEDYIIMHDLRVLNYILEKFRTIPEMPKEIQQTRWHFLLETYIERSPEFFNVFGGLINV